MAKIYLTEETLNKALDTKLAPINAKLVDLEKKVEALSVKDNGVKEDKAPSKNSKTSKGTKGTAKKSQKKEEAPQPEKTTVTRCYITATKHLDSAVFTKVYALVKKHNGKIKNSNEVDKDGKKLACWTFSKEDGKAFADEVVSSKVFGKAKKTIPLKSQMVEVAITK